MYNQELSQNIISAMKSCELEGFVYTEEEQKFFAKIASGELSLSEALNKLKGTF